MIFRKLSLLLLFAASSAYAEISGHAYLGSQNVRVDPDECKFIAENAPHPYLSYLDSTFGESNACLRRFLRAAGDKPNTVEVYMSNEVCRLKGNCQKDADFLPHVPTNVYNEKLCAKDPVILQAVKKKQRQIRRHLELYGKPTTKKLLAIGLESMYSKCAANTLIETAIQVGWKREEIVHNPKNIAPFHGDAGAGFLEHHGLQPVKGTFPTIISLDGECPDFCNGCDKFPGNKLSSHDLSSWLRKNGPRTSYFAFWCPGSNGLTLDSGSAPPPRSRHPKLSSFELNRSYQIAGYLPVKPSNPHNEDGCTSIQDFGNGNILKQSDHEGTVAVLVDRYATVELVAPNGKKFPMEYSGTGNPYNGKDRHHYRIRDRDFHTFPNNLMLKGNGKVCRRSYISGERQG